MVLSLGLHIVNFAPKLYKEMQLKKTHNSNAQLVGAEQTPPQHGGRLQYPSVARWTSTGTKLTGSNGRKFE